MASYSERMDLGGSVCCHKPYALHVKGNNYNLNRVLKLKNKVNVF